MLVCVLRLFSSVAERVLTLRFSWLSCVCVTYHQVLDLATGHGLQSMPLHEPVLALQFDSMRLIAGTRSGSLHTYTWCVWRSLFLTRSLFPMRSWWFARAIVSLGWSMSVFLWGGV